MSVRGESSAAFDEVAKAFVERVRSGDAPDIEDLARAHPGLADDIRRLFPLLKMVEGAKVAATEEEPTVASIGGRLPDEVGGYEVVREIGRGGMGRVVEARRDDERVAIKLVHPHLVRKRNFVDRFLREAQAGMRVDHPGVVRTLGVGATSTEDPQPYLVMEYVEGQNLHDVLLDTGPMPERLCLHVGRCLAEALASIHALDIVHRDVKPENVVITADEQIKLMDLGVALVQEQETRLSRTGEFVGSLLYAAPEQITGRDVDARADLYSLGLLLFELATGQHPLRVDPGASAHPLGRVDGASARAVAPRLSRFFDAIVTTLLRADPDRRFPDAATLAETLTGGIGSGWWRAQAPAEDAWAERMGWDAFDRAPELRGREADVARLDAAFEQAARGEGRIVWIEAEAGLGKSRLVRDWLRSLERSSQDVRILAATHERGAVRGTLPPVGAVLHDAVSGGGFEGRLATLLGPDDELAAAFASYLRMEMTGSDAMTPEVLATAAVRLVRALANEAPVVIVAEDMHFARPSAFELCMQIARAIPGHAALLVMTGRPAEVAPELETALQALADLERIVLEPLSDEDGQALLRQAFDERLDEVVAHRLVQRADGNPYYLLELGREMDGVDPAVLKRTTGPESESGPRLPDSLRGLLTARFSKLTDAQRDLVSAAACCGYEFDPVLVAEALELGRMGALRELARIERVHGLLQQASRNYRFSHHLLQETLLTDLHPAMREALHGAIARALAARGDDPPGLVHHALLGDEPATAFPWLEEALETLHTAGDTAARRALAEQALEHLDALDDATRAVVLFHAGESGSETTPSTEVESLLDRALEASDGDAQPALRRRIRLARAFVWRHQARYEEVLPEVSDLIETARAEGDATRLSALLRLKAGTLRQLGRFDESQAHAEESADVARAAGVTGELSSATNSLAVRCSERGDLQRAQALYLEAAEMAGRCGRRSTQATALSNLAQTLNFLGRYEEARGHCAQTIALARELGSNLVESRGYVYRAMGLAERGHYEEALRDVEHAVRLCEEAEHLETGHSMRLRAIDTALDAGRFHTLPEDVDRALAFAESKASPFPRLNSLSVLAELRMIQGRRAESAEVLQKARELADSISARRHRYRFDRAVGRAPLFDADWAGARQGVEVAHSAAVRTGHMHVTRWTAAIGGVASFELGDVDAARTKLAAALLPMPEASEGGPAALVLAYRALLGAEQAVSARLELEAGETHLPWWARSLAWHALGRATRSDDDRARALTTLAATLETLPGGAGVGAARCGLVAFIESDP